MKIGIDASRAFGKERTGTEEYSYRLIKNLAMMDISRHQVFLYARKNSLIDFDLPDNFQLKIISTNRFWTQIGLASEMMINKPDILFVPSHAIPQIHPAKTVVTIHGLEYRYCPECYSLKERLTLELNTRYSVKWASKIITPSESTKKDLIKFYKIDAEKIKVIYHGVENSKYQASSIKRLNKENSSILFIGRLEKRKNLVNLIKAFKIFKESYKLQATSYKLILAGKAGFGFAEIKKAIQDSPFQKDIILKNYVSEKEKDELYKNASVFILPSFYEGFGLPVLEAMNYGTPVICSNVSSLPEAAGDAALLINPNKPEEIAEAINKIFSDDGLREKMIKKGFQNAQKFSWEKCARETMGKVLSS
ncbi:MAG: glycosyltransferase family 1 protein [Patescibacteria group bacterium]|nr:glycosyltransferase family 1 protein [Patescibacteria group bacterium]